MTNETLRPRASSFLPPDDGSQKTVNRGFSRRFGGRVPLSVGVDVISVAEVAATLDRFGDRYVRRVFTEHESRYCLAAIGAVAAARFAARFAAKEATIKALEPECQWTDWRAIEVRRLRSGRCSVVLHGEAASLAARRGVTRVMLSMSHDGGLAAAVAIGFRETQS